MFVTVTIQTYNRSRMLAETLESLRLLECPDDIDYEILIIDNNSSDDTLDVIKKYRDLLAPRLRSVFEENQGLSHARNRALKDARGEIVCFLDDDVKVSPDWLIAVIDAFRKYNASVVGGRSYLIYPDSRPPWLPVRAETLLSRLDYGDSPLVNTDKELYGLNFSVLKQKALDAGGFDIRFGRNGNKLFSGEEKQLQDKIQKAGGIVVYEPKALVGHIVTPEKLTKKWFFKCVYDGGFSSQKMLAERSKGKVRIGTALIHSIRCWGSVGKSVLSGHATSEQIFIKELHAIRSLGALMEALLSTIWKR